MKYMITYKGDCYCQLASFKFYQHAISYFEKEINIIRLGQLELRDLETGKVLKSIMKTGVPDYPSILDQYNEIK